MKIEVTHITVSRAAKLGALLGFFYSLFVVALMSLGLISSSPWFEKLALGVVALVLAPLFGICYGAILGAVCATAYNFVAGRWGGLEITTRNVANGASAPDQSFAAAE